jgi:hypothetical protein
MQDIQPAIFCNVGDMKSFSENGSRGFPGCVVLPTLYMHYFS